MAAALREGREVEIGAIRSVTLESGEDKNANLCNFLLKSSIIMDLVSYSKLPPLNGVFQPRHHFSVAPSKSQL